MTAGKLKNLQTSWLDSGQVTEQCSIAMALANPNNPLFDGSDIISLFIGKLAKKDSWGRLPVLSSACCLWLGDFTDPIPTSQGQVRLSIRAKDVSIALNYISDVSIQNQLTANITDIMPYRQQLLVQLQLADGQLLQAEITPYAAAQLKLTIGKPVIALVKAIAIR
jgi:molybdate transport system ATP-binding protein